MHVHVCIEKILSKSNKVIVNLSILYRFRTKFSGLK